MPFFVWAVVLFAIVGLSFVLGYISGLSHRPRLPEAQPMWTSTTRVEVPEGDAVPPPPPPPSERPSEPPLPPRDRIWEDPQEAFPVFEPTLPQGAGRPTVLTEDNQRQLMEEIGAVVQATLPPLLRDAVATAKREPRGAGSMDEWYADRSLIPPTTILGQRIARDDE